MTTAPHDPARAARGAMTALAFATVVAMWLTGYLARMPWVDAPGALVLASVLLIFVIGGVAAGRLAGAGPARGALYGLGVSVLNLLVLGGLLTEGGGAARGSALLAVPVSLAAGAVLGAVTAAAGRRTGGAGRAFDWTHALSLVALGATFVLILAGGLVTSLDAGLAVPDWPNTFGYAMFLYPLSRMTGGIFYEHAHRLFGTLVGLTTIAVCWRTWRDRGGVAAWLGAAAVVFVVVQGVLGGLRVTGSFTLAESGAALEPNLALAIVHGVTGQIFLGLLTAIAVMTSPAWNGARPVDAGPYGGGARAAGTALAGLLVVQLVLGAFVRHRGSAVMEHIGFAVVVGVLALVVGTVFWGGVRAPDRLGRLGVALAGLTGLQLALGFAALAVRGGGSAERTFAWYEVATTTAHQVNGALMLALAVAVWLWMLRLKGR